MKKVFAASVVATALTTSVVGAVSAAPAAKPAASTTQIQNSTFTINGNQVIVRSLVKMVKHSLLSATSSKRSEHRPKS